MSVFVFIYFLVCFVISVICSYFIIRVMNDMIDLLRKISNERNNDN